MKSTKGLDPTPSAPSREESVLKPRTVERLVAGTATSDGAGVKLTRVLHGALQKRLDPFLMLDAFGSDDPNDYIAGFPDHPHRGFETVTYMIAGRMKHRDSAGNEGLLENGGVQWMTAGRGVIHSEIPQQEEGVMEGFQLWLNLPGRDKMKAPWYRDFGAADLPRFTAGGVTATVIGGESHGVMQILMHLYRETGQRKYLEPIPRALDYLKQSELPGGRLARFYELQTNRPLYFTKQYELTYNDDDLPTHYSFQSQSWVDAVRAQARVAKEQREHGAADAAEADDEDASGKGGEHGGR